MVRMKIIESEPLLVAEDYALELKVVETVIRQLAAAGGRIVRPADAPFR